MQQLAYVCVCVDVRDRSGGLSRDVQQKSSKRQSEGTLETSLFLGRTELCDLQSDFDPTT